MRKNNVKNLVALLCVVVLVCSMLIGCTQKPATGSTSETSTPTKELIEITAMIYDRGNAPEGVSLTDNRWTQWVNEKMAEKGIHVTFIPVPRSEDKQKVPVMMASGTAADIMMSYQADTVRKFYDDGGTYSLNEYIDETKHADLIKYVGWDVIDRARTENDEIYGIPARRSSTAISNAFIRKDWLDKLNLPVPQTVEELLFTLEQFKNNNPDGLSPTEVVAFQQYNNNTEVLKNAYLSAADPRSAFINGEFATVLGDSGYVEYMRFKNKLYNDGLMDPEFFTESGSGNAKRASELFVQGKLGYFEFYVNGNVDNIRGSLLQTLQQSYPDAEMISMPPVQNIYDGEIYNSAYPSTGAYVFIPKTAKNPEACIEYLNFLAGEGGFTTFHGFEGEHFNFDENQTPVVIDSDYNATDKDWIRHDLLLVGNGGYYLTEEEFIRATSKELPGFEEIITENYENAMIGGKLAPFVFTSDLQAQQSANIAKVNDQYKVEAVTVTPDKFDSVIEKWKAELKKYDVEALMQERADYYDNVYMKNK